MGSPAPGGGAAGVVGVRSVWVKGGTLPAALCGAAAPAAGAISLVGPRAAGSAPWPGARLLGVFTARGGESAAYGAGGGMGGAARSPGGALDLCVGQPE